jgi:hypothetical protein
MPTSELPVPYPRNEQEAHTLMLMYVVWACSCLAVLIVQAIREDDIGFMLALLRYLLWRRRIRKQRRR